MTDMIVMGKNNPYKVSLSLSQKKNYLVPVTIEHFKGYQCFILKDQNITMNEKT